MSALSLFTLFHTAASVIDLTRDGDADTHMTTNVEFIDLTGDSDTGEEQEQHPQPQTRPRQISRWVLRYFFPEHEQQLNPCVQDGLMTMWCCKLTSYYTHVRVGDMMIVFASKTTHKRTGLVMYVCRWTEILDVHAYLNDPQYRHRYDCMYNTITSPWTRNENGGPWHRGDHNDTRRGKRNITDFEYDQTRTRVLLSTQFVDMHANPQPLPRHLEHLTHTGIGCSKRCREGDAEALRAWYLI